MLSTYNHFECVPQKLLRQPLIYPGVHDFRISHSGSDHGHVAKYKATPFRTPGYWARIQAGCCCFGSGQIPFGLRCFVYLREHPKRSILVMWHTCAIFCFSLIISFLLGLLRWCSARTCFSFRQEHILVGGAERR
jgi:hypothetical protein